jgi:S-adenosylmethionine/arginine decarboxylase-like enzyme
MKAIHLVGDLDRCNCTDSFLRSCDVLEHLLATECSAVGLPVVASTFHQSGTDTAPEGVTGAVLLEGSHVCVCTWAELRSVTLDVYVCSPGKDNSAMARDLFRRLVALFAPESAEASVLHRGGKGTVAREGATIGAGD